MNCIEAADVEVVRGGKAVLSGVDFALAPGELVGLLGPNGSGKTTLMRAVAGLQPLARGHVRLGGTTMANLAPRERARRLGYLPQHARFHWPLSVAGAVALGRHAAGASVFGLSPSDRRAIDEAVAATGLGAFTDRRVDELSGGEAMRVHLARLLAGGHAALVADEPLTSLDPRFQLELLSLLRLQTDRGVGVVLSLHDLSLAYRHCDRIVVMNEGTVAVTGTPDRVFDDPLLGSVFGIEIGRAGTGITIAARRTGTAARGEYTE